MSAGTYRAWTISDHVREMHEGGTRIDLICFALNLRPETVERWISQKTKTPPGSQDGCRARSL